MALGWPGAHNVSVCVEVPACIRQELSSASSSGSSRDLPPLCTFRSNPLYVISTQWQQCVCVSAWAEVVFLTCHIHCLYKLCLQKDPGGLRLSSTHSFTVIYKTALFLTGVSHTVVLSSEKSEVPGSWAAHPVCVKAKTCGQKTWCTRRCPDWAVALLVLTQNMLL